MYRTYTNWMFYITEVNFIYLGYSASLKCILILSLLQEAANLLANNFNNEVFPQIHCCGNTMLLVSN